MGDVLVLRSVPVELTSDIGRAFIVDATKAAEGLISDRELQVKYELSPADFQNLAKDAALGRAIRLERERRVLNGQAAQQSAAKHLVKMPTLLAGIAENPLSNPRHVIEVSKELRATAAGSNGTEGLPESERFIITINIDGQAPLHFDKPIKPIKIVSDGDGPNNNLIPLEGGPDVHE